MNGMRGLRRSRCFVALSSSAILLAGSPVAREPFLRFGPEPVKTTRNASQLENTSSRFGKYNEVIRQASSGSVAGVCPFSHPRVSTGLFLNVDLLTEPQMSPSGLIAGFIAGTFSRTLVFASGMIAIAMHVRPQDPKTFVSIRILSSFNVPLSYIMRSL